MLVTVPTMVILNFCLNDPWLSAAEKISLLYIFTFAYAHSAHMVCVLKCIPRAI